MTAKFAEFKKILSTGLLGQFGDKLARGKISYMLGIHMVFVRHICVIYKRGGVVNVVQC